MSELPKGKAPSCVSNKAWLRPNQRLQQELRLCSGVGRRVWRIKPAAGTLNQNQLLEEHNDQSGQTLSLKPGAVQLKFMDWIIILSQLCPVFVCFFVFSFCICVRLATYAAKMPTSTSFLCVERQLWSNDMDSESERGSGDIEKAAESDN